MRAERDLREKRSKMRLDEPVWLFLAPFTEGFCALFCSVTICQANETKKIWLAFPCTFPWSSELSFRKGTLTMDLLILLVTISPLFYKDPILGV
jgi:hypothetical protein